MKLSIGMQSLKMLIDQPQVHRNEFLANYLYSFRNRLSEFNTKHGIVYEYDHKTGYYKLVTKQKAIELFETVTGKVESVKPKDSRVQTLF